jgi:hypothetical protein
MLIIPLKEKLKDIEAELAEQTDRGAAIIWSAIVEDFLSDALQARLILTGGTKERLFNHEKNGPLADFAGKINVALAVGVIVPKMGNDLHHIRRIRNRFAHQPEPLKFSDPKIAAWCSSLETPMFGETNPRRRYNLVCAGMSAALAITAMLPVRLNSVYSNPDLQSKSQAAMRQLLDRHMEHLDKRKS